MILRPINRIGRYLLLAILTIILIAMMVSYRNVIGLELASLVYTPAQQAYLQANIFRTIDQLPAAFNFVNFGATQDGTGAIVPAVFPVWEHKVEATLDTHFEEQEGVSVTVYDLEFQSEYHLQAPSEAASVELIFPFPQNLETLHDVKLLINDVEPEGVQYTAQHIRWITDLLPNEEYDIVISYRAEGVNSFAYGLYQDRRLDKLEVTIDVQGVAGTEVLDASLPPTSDTSTDQGSRFGWEYTNLVANRDIQIELPQRLSFAQRVSALQEDFYTLSLAAPFLVGLYLLSLAGLLYLNGQRLEPEIYLLMGLGIALFYPMLTFLSGLMALPFAAALALLITVALQLLFLRWAADWRRVGSRAMLLLAIFLGVFSIGLLMPLRGLFLTIGGLVLVVIFMIAYARREVPAPVEGKRTASTSKTPEGEIIAGTVVHCPQCARILEAGDQFCSKCGYDLQQLHECPACAYEQWVDSAIDKAYCLRCGTALD